jgi:hypothetical protein
MSTALGLAMQISANTAQLAQAVRDVNKRLDSISDAGEKAAKKLGVLEKIEIGKIALSGATALSNGILSIGRSCTSVISDLVSFGKQVGDQLDALNDIAQRTGVSVEALQAYGQAAKLAGVESEAFAKALQKLTINIGEAAGNEKAQKAFADLGIAFDELRTKSPAEQFEMVADALSNISDPAERAAAAVKLFGKGGIELGPLFTEGPGAMKAMREEAEKLGLVVSEEGVKAIAAMNDSVDQLFQTFTAIVGQVVSKLAPVVTDMAKQLLGVVQSMGGENIANIVVKVLLDAIDFVAQALLRFGQFLDQLVKTIGPLIGIDLRTALQKEIDELSTRLQWSLPSESEVKRLAELRLQAEKEAAEKAAQASYETIIESIKKATDEARRRLGPDKPPSGPGGAGGPFSDQGIIRELKELNKNSRYGVVEILD